MGFLFADLFMFFFLIFPLTKYLLLKRWKDTWNKRLNDFLQGREHAIIKIKISFPLAIEDCLFESMPEHWQNIHCKSHFMLSK